MFDGSMTLCYHPMNFPKHVVGGAEKHRSSSSRGQACRSALGSSDMQTSEIGNLSGPRNSFPVLSLANTVGVIGGVSAVSTLNFLEKLVRWRSEYGEESLPFIVCSDPVLTRELSSYESERSRSPYPYVNNSRKTTLSRFNHALFLENLRQKRLFLERSGARCIVMPCHISHTWHTQISEGCSVPFLHVAECVAMELEAANLKPIEAGSNLRIGLLATEAILSAGFYQEKLQNQGFEVLLPDRATMDHTIIPAIEASNRGDMEGARNLLRIAFQVLLVRAANTVILASDDMHGLLPRDDPLLKKCTDPMDALLRSTLQWARSTEKDDQFALE